MRNILIFGDSIVAGRGISKSQSWVSLLTQLMDTFSIKEEENFISAFCPGGQAEAKPANLAQILKPCYSMDRREPIVGF